MHSSPYGPAGGGLKGTFPNPQVVTDEASLVIARQVFLRHGAAPSASTSAGGGGLTNWAEGRDTASPNNVIPVTWFIPNNTNDDIAIRLGVGAFMLEIPNAGFAHGNKRGSQAVDLQVSRGSSTQVASGQWSGLFAGLGNSATATASGCFVGNSNTAGAAEAVCLGGSGATASGSNAATVGGTSLTASGSNSIATGANAVADALNSSGFGQGWSTRGVIGSHVHSSGVSGGTGTGTEQSMHLTLRATTTDAATTVVPTTNGAVAAATNQWFMKNNSGTILRAKVVARNGSTGNLAGWIISAMTKNVAGTVSLSGTVTGGGAATMGDAAMSTCTCNAVADNTNKCLQFNVTGIAATTITWTVEGWSAENTA